MNKYRSSLYPSAQSRWIYKG